MAIFNVSRETFLHNIKSNKMFVVKHFTNIKKIGLGASFGISIKMFHVKHF